MKVILDTVLEMFESVLGIKADHDAVMSRSKKRRITERRMMVMVLAYDEDYPHLKNLRIIGLFFGKSHATIIHGITTMTTLIQEDKRYKEIYYQCKKRLLDKNLL